MRLLSCSPRGPQVAVERDGEQRVDGDNRLVQPRYVGEDAGQGTLRELFVVSGKGLLQVGRPDRVAGKTALGVGIELCDSFVGEKQIQSLPEIRGIAQPQNLPAVDGEERSVSFSESGGRCGIALLHISREFPVESLDSHRCVKGKTLFLRRLAVAGNECGNQQADGSGIAAEFFGGYHI